MKPIAIKKFYQFLVVALLVLVSNGTEILYQSHKQTMGLQCLFFQAEKGQQLKFEIKYQQNCVFDIFVQGADEVGFPQNYDYYQWGRLSGNYFSNVYTIKKKAFHIVCTSVFTNLNTDLKIYVVKLRAYLDNILVSAEQFTVTPFPYEYVKRILIPIVTTKQCKVNFQLNGPPLVSLQLFDKSQFDKPPLHTLPNGVTSGVFQLAGPGTYYAVAFHNYYYFQDLKNYTAQVTTYTDNLCSNPCFDKNRDLQMVSGTKTDQCVCHPNIGYYLNPVSGLCDCIDINCKSIKPGVCGNGVLQTLEKCDNGNNTGCSKNCVPDVGYTCTGAFGKLSSCFQNICGDKLLANGEECDNGNQIGCESCKIVLGFACIGSLGQVSNCSQKCGDGIKTSTEQCDNGNKTGCIGCKIGTGFNCIHNLYSLSLCYQVCGDGIRTFSEACDNKNSAGCSSNCQITPGYSCTGDIGLPSVCQTKCGDGVVGDSEKCDNGNKDGCTPNCVPDAGYVCTNKIGKVSVCSQVCGDGIRTKNQKCDNGKKAGCLKCTEFDKGFTCSGDIGKSSVCTADCGDKILTTTEGCDNGNSTGCSSNCQPDTGYSCTNTLGSASTCSEVCGDYKIVGTEQCDNGKKIGCQTCKVDDGYECKQDPIGKFSVCTKK